MDEKKHLSGRGKLRAHDRRFIGAEEILSALETLDGSNVTEVSSDDVCAQDFNLTVERYLTRPLQMLSNQDRSMVPLGELVDIVKPQFLKADEGPDGNAIQEAVPSDMPTYGYLEGVERIRRVDPKSLESRRKQILNRNDVLLSTKGTIGVVAIARPDPESGVPLLPSQASVILRLKSGGPIEDPRYLAIYLRSPSVQKALGALASGGTIPNISMNDLRALPVWVPDSEHQANFIDLFDQQAKMQKEIETLIREQQSLAQEAWRSAGLTDLQYRQHFNKGATSKHRENG